MYINLHTCAWYGQVCSYQSKLHWQKMRVLSTYSELADITYDFVIVFWLSYDLND